jgi:hypothetical protein
MLSGRGEAERIEFHRQHQSSDLEGKPDINLSASDIFAPIPIQSLESHYSTAPLP